HCDGSGDSFVGIATTAVVISQHLSASPPPIGDRLPALADLDPVFAKALAKDPKDRYQRCIDFARALGHRLGGGGDADETIARPVAVPVPPAKRSLVRPAVLIPALLAILLVIATLVALREFQRADDERVVSATTAGSPATTTTSAPTTSTTTTSTTTPPTTPSTTAAAQTETTTSAAPAPVVVIGAVCAPQGSTGLTKTGATAYCSTLQGTNTTIWSLTPGTVASPTIPATAEPTESPLPTEQESPIRICMQQTGQTRRQCREEIRRSNGWP
ncbi:serine/threonine protein kinase, partial [Mycobacterium kansasii]